MEGTGPDVVFADRYQLERRIAHRDDLEHWLARDQTLDRAVGITVFAQSHPHCAAALDGARRAAGVEDSRLVRVLDVGRHADLAFVVEESLSDAESLAALTADGPLPAEETRRITGETAAALENARTRGLHHLRLTPHAVLRVGSGGVKISGVAVAAALDGADDIPAADASIIDATAVVALAYMGLTATWPLADVSGVPPARRTAGGVREPADVVRGVPADLNTLCRLTLNDKDGPSTPGAIATQLAPWSAEPVREYATGVERPRRSGRGRGGVAAARDHETTQALPVAAVAEGLATGAGREPASGTSWRDRGEGSSAQQARPSPAAQGEQQAGPEQPEPTSPEESTAGGPQFDQSGYRLREEELEPPLPLLPANAGNGEPDRAQIGLAIGLAAVLVVIALILAIWGVNKIGSPARHAVASTSSSTSSTSRTSTTSSSTTTSSSPRSTTSVGPITITSAKLIGATPGYDHPEDVQLVHDGKTSTSWSSTGYARQDFNGLKKGMGVVLDLGRTAKVSKVKLTLPGTSQLTVYVGRSASSIAGASPLGSVSSKSGTITLKASGKPLSGRYVTVWFTKAETASGGFNKCQLAEVVVS